MKRQLQLKSILLAAALFVGANVWADDWTTVWTTDFSSAPSGMTYSVTNGSTEITNGYLSYHQGGKSGNRAINTAFTDSKFAVDTNWKMEFDWNCSSSNANSSNVVFATNNGDAFTLTWAKYATGVVVTNASSAELTTELPLLGYNKGTCDSWSHITITGNTENGIYLTITNGETTYVDNVLVTSTFGYPATFNGSLGRAVSHMHIDNISFATPKVAGYVAPPTGTITAPDGTARKFTLSCLTEGTTIYYAESDLEIGAAGWSTYSSEVTTSAETIYAYASDGVNNSEIINFATGAGTTVSLLDATLTHSGNGVYAISSDQSAVLGAPAATIHYQIDGGEEKTSVNSPVTVNISADGTLTYWLTADGYEPMSPANETVYAAVGYAYTTTIDFCTSNANDWALHGDEVTVSGDDGHTYYKYMDQNSNILGDGLLATSFTQSTTDNSWRIQRYNGGTAPYNSTEYIALLNLNAGQIVQFVCNSAPTIVSNLTVVPAATYTGTYTYTATAAGDVIVSLGKGVIITKIHLCATSVPVDIKTSGTTFSSAYPIDCANLPEGVTAYQVTTVANGKAMAVKVTEAVAANTGLILKSTTAGSFNISVAATGTDISATNKLQAAVTATPVAENDNKYGLSEGVFKKLAEGTIPAGKAYLEYTAPGAPELGIVFDDVTGVNDVRSKTADVRDEFYDLQGRKVAQPTKGLYIVNGKKVITK